MQPWLVGQLLGALSHTLKVKGRVPSLVGRIQEAKGLMFLSYIDVLPHVSLSLSKLVKPQSWVRIKKRHITKGKPVNV